MINLEYSGTADNIIHSIKAEFASTLKSPFVQTEAIKAQIGNQESTSGYSTLSSVGSTERSDEEPTGSYGLSYLDQSRHSVHSTQSAPLVRSDLDSAYGTASGSSTRNRTYNSFRSTSDPPMQVNDLLNNSTYSSYSPSGSGNLINEHHVIRDQHRVKPIKPQRSYYVGKQATPPPPPTGASSASSSQLPPKYHNKSNPPTYQKSQSATSLALNRPIYKLTNQNRSYNHSKL